MGPGLASECGARRSKGCSGGSKQPFLTPNPVTPSLGRELGERQARAARAREAPLAPLLLLDGAVVLACYWAGPGVEFFRGPLRWDGGILYRCLNGHAQTDTHRQDLQKDLHSCMKGTPPLTNVAAALCEPLSNTHADTHRWRAAASHPHTTHRAKKGLSCFYINYFYVLFQLKLIRAFRYFIKFDFPSFPSLGYISLVWSQFGLGFKSLCICVNTSVFMHVCTKSRPCPYVDHDGVFFAQTSNQIETHKVSGNFLPIFKRISIWEMIRHRELQLHASLPLAGQSSSTGTSVSLAFFSPFHPLSSFSASSSVSSFTRHFLSSLFPLLVFKPSLHFVVLLSVLHNQSCLVK